MPKLDLAAIPVQRGTGYPRPYDAPCHAREQQRLGDAAGLTRLGANLVRLPPGAWSSQRHWHTHEDELVWIVAGELVLVSEAGEDVLRAGDVAASPTGVADGHHLQNRSSADAVFLVVGNRDPADVGHYPDIDLAVRPNRYAAASFTAKDGSSRPG